MLVVMNMAPKPEALCKVKPDYAIYILVVRADSKGTVKITQNMTNKCFDGSITSNLGFLNFPKYVQ